MGQGNDEKEAPDPEAEQSDYHHNDNDLNWLSDDDNGDDDDDDKWFNN